MSSTCPSCGAAVEFESRPARLLRGGCDACGGHFSIAQELSAEEAASSEAGKGTGRVEPGPAAAPTVPGLLCPDCEEPLEVRSRSPTSLETSCASCGNVVRYVVDRPARWSGPERGRPSGPDRGRFRPATAGGGPPARPCRECGGPLSFSTDANGNVTGTCTSCGNTFTLPPRRDGPSGGFRSSRPAGRGRFGSSRPPGRGPPRREWRDSGDRPNRFRRARPAEGDDDQDRRRRRRFRRE